ncbi:thioesterase-like superfamily-domain-containing protein [Xylaria nigripes]|nr:thioesterase-like superfamily-domain-containing protein [Xylaria nigripes]
MASTFAEATAVKAAGSHTYTAHFHSEWCVGSVPHGGMVTATFLRVAATHYSTTLAAQRQPHTITLHVEFLRRTSEGPATFTVKDIKLGRQTSTVHITLIQDGREKVVAYLTNGNMNTETGLTLRTDWSLTPPPPPQPADFAKLAADEEDANWVLYKNLPNAKVRKVTNRVYMYHPRVGQERPSIIDQWVRLKSGEKLTMESIGFVADVWPQILEGLVRRQQGADRERLAVKNRKGDVSWLWYPTLTLNLDIKKALPAEGVEWLYVRVYSKMIKNGRFDYEVVIFDDTGDVVALSHHVAMILNGSRNLATRGTGESKM